MLAQYSQLIKSNVIYYLAFSSGTGTSSTQATIPGATITPDYLTMSSKIDPVHGNITKDISSEPEYITAECVRQKKMANAATIAAQQNSNINNNNGKSF